MCSPERDGERERRKKHLWMGCTYMGICSPFPHPVGTWGTHAHKWFLSHQNWIQTVHSTMWDLDPLTTRLWIPSVPLFFMNRKGSHGYFIIAGFKWGNYGVRLWCSSKTPHSVRPTRMEGAWVHIWRPPWVSWAHACPSPGCQKWDVDCVIRTMLRGCLCLSHSLKKWRNKFKKKVGKKKRRKMK